jgi:hypothetical protein
MYLLYLQPLDELASRIQSTAQKVSYLDTSFLRPLTLGNQVVQARMWAQGLTIGILIAAGALTQAKRAEALKHVSINIADMPPG